jgi:hypothetical protein
MGSIKPPQSVKLFVGILASSEEGLRSGSEMLSARFGPIDLESEVLPFNFTDYYEKEMGPIILRKLLGFRELILPDIIAAIKCETNSMEETLASKLRAPVPRPVNLDPGYLGAGKVVLATTKDYSHRLYLTDGIYAEVTLHHSKGRWEPWPWTYPDYKTEAYIRFFARMRELLLAAKRE